MRFRIPYPPSKNNLYRTVIKGRGANARAFPIKTAVYRDYEARVRQVFMSTSKNPFRKGETVAVTLHVYRPKKIGDLDGRLTATMDVIQGIAYENDNQVIELRAFRHDDKNNPHVSVQVWDVIEQPEEEW